MAVTLIGAGHKVTGLVRSEARASDVERFGIEPVIGDLADAQVLESDSDRGINLPVLRAPG